jgi:hypothetical protein
MSKMTLLKWRMIVAEFNVLIPGHVIDAIYCRVMEEMRDPNEAKNPGQQAIAFFCEAHAKMRGSKAIFEAKDTRRLKDLAKQVGMTKLKDLILTYFSMNDPIFVSRSFDLFTFLNSVSRIQQKLDHGQAPTQEEARRIDKTQTNVNAFTGLLAKARGRDAK